MAQDLLAKLIDTLNAWTLALKVKQEAEHANQAVISTEEAVIALGKLANRDKQESEERFREALKQLGARAKGPTRGL